MACQCDELAGHFAFLLKNAKLQKNFFKKILPFICTKPQKKRWKIEGTFSFRGTKDRHIPFQNSTMAQSPGGSFGSGVQIPGVP